VGKTTVAPVEAAAAEDMRRTTASLPQLLVLVTLGACCGSTEVPWPFYHTLDDTLGFFDAAAARYPGLVQYTQAKDERTGEKLPLVTITDFAVDEDKKETVLLVFAEHAREIITTEISLWLTKVLVGEVEDFETWPATVAMHAENAVRGVGPEDGGTAQWTGHLLQHIVFKLFPVVNLEGRKRVENGEFCLRKKVNGVDLNRNYPVAFQKERPNSEDFGGPFAFSEPESRVIRSEVNERDSKPRVYVSVHSGEWALYYPWDSKMHRGEMLPNTTEALVDNLNIHCKCMNGPAGKVAGYLALGSSMDYMYDMAHVTYPLTVEVYGPNGLGTFAAGGHPRHLQQVMGGLRPRRVSSLRCLTEYNPPTEELYQDTVARWVGSFLAMADFLAPFRPPPKVQAAEGLVQGGIRSPRGNAGVAGSLGVMEKMDARSERRDDAFVEATAPRIATGARQQETLDSVSLFPKPAASPLTIEKRGGEGGAALSATDNSVGKAKGRALYEPMSISSRSSQALPASPGRYQSGVSDWRRGSSSGSPAAYDIKFGAIIMGVSAVVFILCIRRWRSHQPKNRTL